MEKSYFILLAPYFRKGGKALEIDLSDLLEENYRLYLID